MSQVAKEELVGLFYKEIGSYIPGMRQNIDKIDTAGFSITPLSELHRLFHNIKGAAAQVGKKDLSNGARLVENCLDGLVGNEQAVTNEQLIAFRKTTELIDTYIALGSEDSTAENETDFYNKIVSYFQPPKTDDPVADTAEGGVNGWKSSLKSVLPLLRDLAECTSADEADLEHNRLVFKKMSQAVSIVVACVRSGGMVGSKYELIADFQQLLDKVCRTPEKYYLELPDLIADFVQFLDVVLSKEGGRQTKEPSRSLEGIDIEETVDTEILASDFEAGFFDVVEGEEETSTFMEHLPDADLAYVELETEDEKQQDEVGEIDEDQRLLYEIFQSECDEHLIVINHSLNNLEKEVKNVQDISPSIREDLSNMRRAVHTLKGAAAMTNVNLLARGGHALEDMLDWLHGNTEEITAKEVEILATGVDVIELLAQIPASEESPHLDNLVAIIAEYLESKTVEQGIDVANDEEYAEDFATEDAADESEIISADTAKMAPLPLETQVAEPPLPQETGSLRVKLDELDELSSIEGELVVARGAMEKMVDEFYDTLSELDTVKNSLRRKSQELEAGFEVQSLYGFSPLAPGMESEERSASGLDEFDPIELDRYSQLNLIIRSLNEISVDVNSIFSTMTSLASDLRGQIGKQQLTMRLMQEKLMRIRMTPMSSISRILFRTVRDTAKRLDKNVNLTIIGEDVYMDRFVWGKITDPLMHILRNCVDHGIETAEFREIAGKPETGAIKVVAEQRSRFVLLKISDDGGGIDLNKVKEKIKSMGLAGDPESLAEDELLTYLFTQSFSTRDDVSQVSGRGVGLDVVKKNIQELRGTVQLYNTPGKGVTFELQIPFTLSVNRAILVDVAGKQFAVPLQDIIQVKHFLPEELDDRDGLAVRLNDELIPVTNLGYYLQLEEPMSSFPNIAEGLLVILFSQDNRQVAVSIDTIIEQREIVVKSLGSHLTHVRGISGVTATGAAGLIPILNLAELVAPDIIKTVSLTEPEVELALSEPLRVLIVDDSISVRHSVARLIESKGWKQQQAVDGLDALAKLETFVPDVVVLDIEMPRMNGYELKSNLNNQPRFRDIPVIMLTSRVSEKHQQKAKELGVEHYITKPYQEDDFVRLLESFVRR